MLRRCVLLCALLVTPGCITDADRAKWDEAMSDLRGDRSQMRSSGASDRRGDAELPKGSLHRP